MFLLVSMTLVLAAQSKDPVLFANPGRMIDVGKGSRLSLYCSGTGSPTVVLESGFGGGTAATWDTLQPLLNKKVRVCSYDRAGYGFSTLGSNVPRDLNHAVADLDRLLQRSGEKPPYILAGHSNGGLIVGAFADLHPSKVKGLIFLDAAVSLPIDRETTPAPPAPIDESLQKHLDQIRRCLDRANKGLKASPSDECVDSNWYSTVPRDLARAEIANRSKPDFWRAYLSEAESNYGPAISNQARSLLPHRWTKIPIRVFIADMGRGRFEERQAHVCTLSSNCKVTRVPTKNHLVHNEALPQVVESIAELTQ